MGQLKNTVSELSRLTNSVCIGVFLMIGLLSVCVYAEDEIEEGNCEFLTDSLDKTVTPWVIVGDEISEKTTPNTTIWNKNTRNVRSSAADYHSHVKYLTGHRFDSRYEYRASSSFPNFVEAEKSKAISRLVTFGCGNGYNVKVRFVFPLIDENDAPSFLQVPNKELQVTLGSTDIINKDDSIVVVDKDFDSKYNAVTGTTDRPDVLVVRSIEESLSNGIGKKFHVELTLNSTEGNVIQPGRYSLNLFASDGQWTANAPLKINIVSASN